MEYYSLLKIKLAVLCMFCFASITQAQTLIMNEVSNGPAGNQEYVEFVVVSNTVTYNCSSPIPPCIDIRGWIFDDNSGYHGTGGIATGAVRFSNNILWSCVPVGTIIVIYNNGDPNPAMPADDLSLTDGNCAIIAPLNSILFESNSTTPGAVACSYPVTGWTPGGNWNNTLLANAGDCARIVDLAGCEVFSVCWATDNLNNLIYFNSGGSGSQNVWYFNGVDPTIQSNWSEGSTTPIPGAQTPGAPNNAANAAYIAQFNNGCAPITPINVTASAVNAGCTCNGSATATATGSIPGYTYIWYNSVFAPIGQTTATATALCAGVYNIIASSSIGCSDTATVTITSTSITTVTVNSQSICSGSTTTLTATPSITGGTYSWAPGGQTTQTISINPITTTTYTVTYTLSGCSSTGTGTVTVTPLPVTTVNSPSVCPTFTANLMAGGATSYTWTAGATATGVNTADASPATTTTYTVTGNSLGCTSTAVATVTVNVVLTVDAGLDDTICFGGNVSLIVIPNGAGYSYAWNAAGSLSDPTIFNPVASPIATTTYTVNVTDPGGCVGSDSITVYANPQITVAIAGIDVTCNGACNGQTIVIPGGGTPAYSYLWSSGCTTASCTSLCPGSYTVTVTDSWGCIATADTTIFEPTLLTGSVTASTPATCNGICDGTATAAGNGGTPGTGYTYSWNTVPVQNTAIATGLCAGSYTCTITDANSCTASTTLTIAEPTLVVIAPIVSVIICPGGSTAITANASGGNGIPYNYVWSPAGTGTTASITVSPVGTTTYTVNATDNSGCPAFPVTVTVTVNPALIVAASGTASICPGASASISALASFGNGGPYTYSWAPTGTLSGTPVLVSPAVTTTYTVTASDGCSPTATATVTVTVLPLPIVIFSADDTSGCEPLCVNLTNNSTVAGGTITGWLWDYGDGSAPDTAHYHCYNSAGQYTVGLTVMSSLGGCVSTVAYTNYINVFPLPVAEFSSNLTETDIFNPTINFLNQSSGASIFQWSFGDLSTSNQINPVHTYENEGQYFVWLIATSDYGCVDSIMHPIQINGAFTFYAPNSFTPNDDLSNNIFLPRGIGWDPEKFELMIFDRWGNLCYDTKDMNKGWDGRANHGSEIAQEDVYVWKVILTDVFDKRHNYIGSVTIIK